MNGATSSSFYKITFPDGLSFDVPEHDWDYALSREMGGEIVGESFEAPVQQEAAVQSQETQQQLAQQTPSPPKIHKVTFPDGLSFDVPENDLAEARRMGGQVVNVDPNYYDAGKLSARSVKSLASGAVGGLADTATSIYNLPAMAENAKTPEMKANSPSGFAPESFVPEAPAYPEAQIPLIPSAEHAIDSSIDEATGGYTKTQEGDSFQAGLRMVGGVALPGGLAKGAAKIGAKGAAKVLGALGTIKPTGLAAAGAAGAASSEASKAGYGGVASTAIGLGAGAITGGAPGVAKALNAKLALAKLTGNSPKNINLKAVEAFEAAGLPYTNTTVNESRALSLVDQLISKTPHYGTKQAETLRVNDKAYEIALDEAIAKVGERIAQHDSPSSLDTGNIIKEVFEDTKAVTNKIKNELYGESNKLLPPGAEGMPSHLSGSINNIRKTIKTLRPSTDETFLLKYLDDLEAGFILGGEGAKTILPVPVEMLVGTKRSLNDIINWDVKASGVRNQLKQLQHASQQDIEAYGKTNQKWYESYKKADSFYGERLGSKAFSSDTVKKKILSEENPEKILGTLNDISDFKALKQSLGVTDSGSKFFNSIKREKLTDLIMGKTINTNKESVNYSGFAKAMENPRTKELIKYLAGDNYKELDKFLSVSKAAIRRNDRIPNPSGTAPTNTVINSILGSMGGTAGMIAGLKSTAGSSGGLLAAAYGLNWLITNKKMLNIGIEAAKKQAAGDLKAANILSGRIERSMINDLGDDFVRQFIALSSKD